MRPGDRDAIAGASRQPLPTCVNGLPELPAAFVATIRAGIVGIPAADAALPAGTAGPALAGQDVSPALPGAALAAFETHTRLLLAWNSAINLTAVRHPEDIAREHVLDSLTALPVLRRAGVYEFVDLGSGAGFPGIPLAAALPARRALLVESIFKKARFLEAVLGAVELPGVRVAAARAESLAADPHHRGRWQAVVARAVADLAEIEELALPLLRPGGLLVAWKRPPLDEELARAERALRQLHGRVAAVEAVTVAGLEDHVLAVVEKTGETPREFPRDPAARRRRPLGGAGAERIVAAGAGRNAEASGDHR